MSHARGAAAARRPIRSEAAEETTLRPRRLDEFVGQPELKEHLEIMLEAARQRGQAVDHLLLRRPARASARPRWPASSPTEMGVAPAASRAGPRSSAPATSPRSSPTSTTATCCSSTRSTACRAPVEEVLYPAMEDFQLDIVLGKGPAARSIRLDLPRFTLVGATTRTGLITGPLRDRFGFVARLDYYDADELAAIVDARRADPRRRRSTPRARARSPAARAGTPRIANRLLQRVRDFAEVRGDGAVDRRRSRATRSALFGVDELGLDKVDRAILARAVPHVRGRPGRARHARDRGGRGARDGRGRLRAVPHPGGLLERTPRGRVATAAGVRPPRLARSRRARRGSRPVLSRRDHARWEPT